MRFGASFVLFLLLQLSSNVLAQVNIFDAFNDNSNRWPLASGVDGSMKIENGYYEISSTNDGFWQYTHQVDSALLGHFRIETSVERSVGTLPGKSCGIVWGNASDTARFAFLIYGDGSFVVQRLVKGVSTFLIAPTKSNAIHTSGYNNLRVERNMELNEYQFSVNEQLVGSKAFIAPSSQEFGLYADMGGTFHFDNFWFVRNGNTSNDYQPQFLFGVKRCGYESLNYSSTDWGYSFCVPEGWRVDTYKESRVSVWQIGAANGGNAIVADFSKLAIQDSFRVAAHIDFKILIDSANHAYEKHPSPLEAVPTSASGEAWHAHATYISMEDETSYTIDRYYVYNASTGAFLLFQILVPTAETKLIEEYNAVTKAMVATIVWP